MARYGRVSFSISYVVDLDDPEMIDEAREMLAEDVQDAIRYGEVSAYIETEPDAAATEADISDYLIERREERLPADPDRGNATMKRITARFHPQVWVNDLAMAVDPQGETEWDVTHEVVAMGREAAIAMRDDDYATDYLRESANAPGWVRDWSGPFYVEVSESIRDFFGADE